MKVKISDSAWQSVLSQAQKDAPKESCGYLLGTDAETVTENYPMTNIDDSTEHFSFDVKEQFEAVKYARKNSLVIVGNWHSHPATPSRPSKEDIRLAFDENILYFILSLKDEKPVFNAFKIQNSKVIEKIEIKS